MSSESEEDWVDIDDNLDWAAEEAAAEAAAAEAAAAEAAAAEAAAAEAAAAEAAARAAEAAAAEAARAREEKAPPLICSICQFNLMQPTPMYEHEEVILYRRQLADWSRGITSHALRTSVQGFPEDSRVALACMHTFHGVCVAQWLGHKSECPECRMPYVYARV